MIQQMNKQHLIDAIRAECEMSAGQADAVVNVLIAAMTDQLASGGEIVFRDFGSLYPKTRQATMGRNPKTGEAIHIPEKTSVKFRTGRGLLARVNGG